jgi:hypothetical protein
MCSLAGSSGTTWAVRVIPSRSDPGIPQRARVQSILQHASEMPAHRKPEEPGQFKVKWARMAMSDGSPAALLGLPSARMRLSMHISRSIHI